MSSASEHDESLWITRSQAAAFVDLSQAHFDETLRKSLPGSAVRGTGRKLRFFGPAVVLSWHQAKVAKLQQVAKATDDDPLLAAGDSPGLERYRLAKARAAEMDLEERVGTHVDLAQLEPLLLRLSANLRSAIEDVQRQWGNEAAGQLNEALDETEQGWLKLVSSTGDDTGKTDA